MRCINISKASVFFFSCLSLLLLHSGNAGAGKIKKLTELNVRAFIEKTTKVTSGHADGMSDKAVIKYLQKHLDDKARFKSTLTYKVPGHPPQETALGLDKSDFIKSIEKGSEAMTRYENRVEIQDIKISSNGRNATVQTTGYESGVMPMPSDGDVKMVPIEGHSTCNQIIKLSKKGVIQMFSAICDTEISFLPYE